MPHRMTTSSPGATAAPAAAQEAPSGRTAKTHSAAGEDAFSDGEDTYGSGAAALAGAGFGAEAAAVQAAGSSTGQDDLLDQVRRCLQARRLYMGSCCLLQSGSCRQPASSPTACRASRHGPVVLIIVASCGSWSPNGDGLTTALLRQRLQQSRQHADAKLH